MTGEIRVSLLLLAVSALFSIALAFVDLPPFRLSSYLANLTLYAGTWAIFASVQILVALVSFRPDRPIAFLREVEFGVEYRKVAVASFPILLAMVIFMPAFSAMKSAIPVFNPFSWDQAFIDLDLWIHGRDPWRIMQPALGFPFVTSILSLTYHLWILLIYAGAVYLLFYLKDRVLRLRYFVAYCAIWTINGVILATLLSSVGPCFVKTMMGNAHYAEQMAYLLKANESYPVMSIEVQQQLMAWHASGSNGLGRGISAMPSMHVSLAFLFFLAMRHVSRNFGIFFFLFFVLILIGSVHLGYHYAVDGYVSIIVTGAIWMACGRMFRASAERESTTSV